MVTPGLLPNVRSQQKHLSRFGAPEVANPMVGGVGSKAEIEYV
jgi:hypothetical protein